MYKNTKYACIFNKYAQNFTKYAQNGAFTNGTPYFCWKVACYTVLQSLQIFIPQKLLQREMLFIIVVA